MAQRERLMGIVLAGSVLAGLMYLVFSFDWTTQGGQYRELGEEIGNRRSGAVRSADYAYVADSSSKQYWPNREPYVSRIPAANRVFILDDAALRKFRGYSPGPR